MQVFYIGVMAAVIAAPLVWLHRRRKQGKSVKTALLAQIAAFFVVGVAGLGLALTGSASAESAAVAATGIEQAIYSGSNVGLGFLAAAIAVGLSGIGGGIAVSSAASAALGALSENESMFGKSLIMVALAEGISLWGLIIAFMILGTLA